MRRQFIMREQTALLWHRWLWPLLFLKGYLHARLHHLIGRQECLIRPHWRPDCHRWSWRKWTTYGIWSHKGQKSSRTRHFSSIHPLLCQCGQEQEKKWLFNLLRQNSSLWHFNYKCRRSELHGFNIQWVTASYDTSMKKCLTLRGFLLESSLFSL